MNTADPPAGFHSYRPIGPTGGGGPGMPPIPSPPDRRGDPDRARAFNRLGLAHRRSGQVRQAVDAFRQAIAIGGDQAEVYKNLGNAYNDGKNWDLAVACFRKAVGLSPTYVEAWYDMGCTLQRQGAVHEASDCYRQVLRHDACHSDALNNLGLILDMQGRIDSAMSCFRQAIAGNPGHARACNNLGNGFRRQGDSRRALACYERALAIAPAMADAHNNKGFALLDLGLATESLESFARAHRLAPESDAILVNYANALLGQGRHRQASACYRTVLGRSPANKQAWFNQGLCHEGLGEPTPAIACYQRALQVDSRYAKAQSRLVSVLMQTCRWNDLRSASDRLDRLTRDALGRHEKPAETPFLNISRHSDIRLNFDVAQAWAREIDQRRCNDGAPTAVAPRSPVTSASRSRVTIGYLSCNFRNHPTAHLMAGLFGRHDRGRFEIACYSYGIDDASSIRETIRRTCDRFVDLRGVGDRHAAERIRSDGVDILVDLGGFTTDSRLGIAAHRPAAIQVRYLGMAGTTGASFFDYLVTDRTVTPPDQADCYAERFLYMPVCYQVNHYQDPDGSPPLGRSDVALPSDAHVYCAFHAAYKIDAAAFRTWMRILERVDNSVLWLCIADPSTREQLTGAARERGIQDHRLIFAENLPRADHLRRLALADTALDTLRVTGAATTSDALWAHVPVVTMLGGHFASRMSGSILKAAGLSRLVTDSLKDYERVAVRMAEDPAWRTAVREQVRQCRSRSPLFDTRRFVRALERGYAMIWERHRQGRPPEMMEIDETDQ